MSKSVKIFSLTNKDGGNDN